MAEYNDEVVDETTVGGPACVLDCAIAECPEDCPCGCDDCIPVRVDDIDPKGLL